MKEITIDCRAFTFRSDLHRAFADALAFPSHYGNNLDALHDCLTDLSLETRIRLLNWQDVQRSLGSYAQAAQRAIGDAAAQNTNLTVYFD